MDPGNLGGSDGGDLRRHPATTTLGEGNHPVPSNQLNNSPLLASESSSQGSVQLGAATAPFTETALRREPNNQTFPVVELGSDLRTSPSTVLPKDDLSAISSSTGHFFEDPFQLHTNAGSTQALSVTAGPPEHGSKPSNDMWTYPATSFEEGDASNRGMVLDQAPPTSSTNPFQLSGIEDSTSNEGSTGPRKIDTTLASDNSDEEFPVSSMHKNEQLGQGLAESPSTTPAIPSHQSELSTSGNSATQSPPVQVMERPGEPGTSAYRLPSYVFARTNTTAPMEWSTASNESLFSIHVGNMSFTGDQFANLGKSGELGLPGELTMSGPLVDFSSKQPPPPPPSNTQTDTGQKGANLDEVSRLTEAKAAETMREVIRESAENQKKEDELLAKGASPVAVKSPSPAPSPSPSPGQSPQASLSHNSDGSIRSFAFPM